MLAFAGAAMMLASCGETSMKVETLDTAVNEALMAGREDSLHVVISLEYPVANISDEARKAICDSISMIAFGQDYAGLDLKEAAGKWSHPSKTPLGFQVLSMICIVSHIARILQPC